jgi:hypothetical protein
MSPQRVYRSVIVRLQLVELSTPADSSSAVCELKLPITKKCCARRGLPCRASCHAPRVASHTSPVRTPNPGTEVRPFDCIRDPCTTRNKRSIQLPIWPGWASSLTRYHFKPLTCLRWSWARQDGALRPCHHGLLAGRSLVSAQLRAGPLSHHMYARWCAERKSGVAAGFKWSMRWRLFARARWPWACEAATQLCWVGATPTGPCCR